jgi:cellulose synthase/poly-beta-1,6-N-acetylglucosamine synthase-like glycosyltransferase
MSAVLFFMGAYSLLVILFIAGWNRARKYEVPGHVKHRRKISLIIPVRNEAAHITKLMSDLPRQGYSDFEVLVVDDHSSDKTSSLLMANKPGNVRVLQNPGAGKKSAITEGVKHANGELIVTTDADCTFHTLWLDIINAYFEDEQLMMLSGPVGFMHDNSFFSKLQEVEFASLIGSGAATAALGFPTMCNGANLAFRKSVFQEVGGYEGNLHVASGDDEFLMRKIHDRYPKGIRFAATDKAIVATHPLPDLRTFFHQRLRWASKWRHNTSVPTVALAIFILGSQLASIGCIVLLLTHVSYLPLVFFCIKAAAEYVFLKKVCAFLKIKWSGLAFIVLQLGYPVYVLVIGIASNFISYKWKGRKLK